MPTAHQQPCGSSADAAGKSGEALGVRVAAQYFTSARSQAADVLISRLWRTVGGNGGRTGGWLIRLVLQDHPRLYKDFLIPMTFSFQWRWRHTGLSFKSNQMSPTSPPRWTLEATEIIKSTSALFTFTSCCNRHNDVTWFEPKEKGRRLTWQTWRRQDWFHLTMHWTHRSKFRRW